MKIFINDRMEIHDVDSTSRTDLIEVNVTDGTFDNWSKAKICCYCANVRGGNVVELYPYVNTTQIEQLDRLSRETEEVQATVSGIYNPNKVYSIGEYCTWNGSLYRFNMETGKGIEPSNNLYWTLCDVATELNRITTLIKER